MQSEEVLTLGDTFTCYTLLLTENAGAWNTAWHTLPVRLGTEGAL